MSQPQLPPVDWTQPVLYVSHRGYQNVWYVEQHSPTIFGNHYVIWGGGTLGMVVDEAGQPIENMYGFAYKEYVVSNEPPEGWVAPT